MNNYQTYQRKVQAHIQDLFNQHRSWVRVAGHIGVLPAVLYKFRKLKAVATPEGTIGSYLLKEKVVSFKLLLLAAIERRAMRTSINITPKKVESVEDVAVLSVVETDAHKELQHLRAVSEAHTQEAARLTQKAKAYSDAADAIESAMSKLTAAISQ